MKRSDALDGLRGIAILLVMGGHAWGTYGKKSGLFSVIDPIFANSSLGVRLFFVLSGYLITTLLLIEREETGGISLRRFYARRALRIFPAFYIFLGVILALKLLGTISVSNLQLATAATYTWNYGELWPGPLEGDRFLGHLWTLSLEEQFYLLWPAFLIFMGSRKAFATALVLVGLMPIARVGSYFLFPSQRGELGMMFHTSIDTIMIGCALALAPRASGVRSSAAPLNRRYVLAVALFFAFIISPFLTERFKGAYSIVFGFTLDAICVSVIIFQVMEATSGECLRRVLSVGVLVFIGRLSYSLYLWQQLFLSAYNRSWSGTFPASILCSFAAAAGSYYLVEKPFLKLKARFSTPGRRSGTSCTGAEGAAALIGNR